MKNGNFIYCPNCGKKLDLKEVKDEGLIKYCSSCNEFFFPQFNVACSMIVVYREETLLIKQYNGQDYILVAGYVMQGESVEEAAIREVKEEVGLDVINLKILKTKYFSKSNTLMINLCCEVKDNKVLSNYEVDSYKWFSYEEALNKIKPNSLAKEFYLNYINNYVGKENVLFSNR